MSQTIAQVSYGDPARRPSLLRRPSKLSLMRKSSQRFRLFRASSKDDIHSAGIEGADYEDGSKSKSGGLRRRFSRNFDHSDQVPGVPSITPCGERRKLSLDTLRDSSDVANLKEEESDYEYYGVEGENEKGEETLETEETEDTEEVEFARPRIQRELSGLSEIGNSIYVDALSSLHSSTTSLVALRSDLSAIGAVNVSSTTITDGNELKVDQPCLHSRKQRTCSTNTVESATTLAESDDVMIGNTNENVMPTGAAGGATTPGGPSALHAKTSQTQLQHPQLPSDRTPLKTHSLNRLNTRSTRKLRSKKSKLDLIDHRHLTTFNFTPPRPTGSPAGSPLNVVENYISTNKRRGSDSSDTTSNASPLAKHKRRSAKPADNTANCSALCLGCNRSLAIHSCFKPIESSLKFLCGNCIDNCHNSLEIGKFTRVIKIEGQDPSINAPGWEPYYILEMATSDWLSSLQHTFRWRWRIKGLIS